MDERANNIQNFLADLRVGKHEMVGHYSSGHYFGRFVYWSYISRKRNYNKFTKLNYQKCIEATKTDQST